MQYSTIAYRVENAILTLTLSRPDRLNAFTVTMADELIHAFDRASEDDAVRAIVVTGAGRAFCAGMDLDASIDVSNDVGNDDAESNKNVFGLNEALHPNLQSLEDNFNDPVMVNGVRDTGGRVVLAIFDCKKPMIAAINGAAVGVGATLILAMDIRIASDKARFAFPFGKLGIVPDACSSWFLPRIVGLAKALEWTYTAEMIDAQEALNCGLIKAVVPHEKLLEEAYSIARKISADRSPVSVALIRQMMYRNSAESHPLQAHKIESLGIFYTSQTDGKEGVAAFREKRPPHFTAASSEMPAFYPWWK